MFAHTASVANWFKCMRVVALAVLDLNLGETDKCFGNHYKAREGR